MWQMTKQHRLPVHRTILLGFAALSTLSISASAQTARPNQETAGANQAVSVALIQNDGSTCTNGDIKDDPNRTRGGEIWVTRMSRGTTNVKVAMTVTPNTRYHFFLKCVRSLGEIRTDDEGVGSASFDFPTSSVGNVFAFEMHPEGAPSGSKFQSLQVAFQ